MAEREENQAPEPGTSPVVRDYVIVCLTALLILTLILLEEGFGLWSVMPLMLGGVCVAGNLGLGPPLVLFSLVVLLSLRSWILGVAAWQRQGTPPLLDLLTAASVLVYLAAATRLMALVRYAVPPDPRRARKPPGPRVAGRWLLPREAAARSSSGIKGNEIVALLVSTPAYVLAAYLLWIRLAVEPPPTWLDLPVALWRALLLVWGAGIALAAAYVFLSYLARALASDRESLLYLQDQLWTATRGEQRRINRWVVWGRLRAGPRGAARGERSEQERAM
jgi:hypothetical protein